MASLPARQQSQRRPSPPDQSSSTQNQQTQPSPSPVRTRSEDSQTVFLNKPDSPQEQAAPNEPPQQTSTNDADDASIKKCWICFSDSTEDTPDTSPWRSPCPCALEAHEECLLDWIADMESPTNTSRRNDSGKITCPQCKSEIKLSRPRSYIVDAVRVLEKLGSDHLYKGAGLVLFGTVYNASMAWGVHSIYAIFGAEDGWRILRPLILNTVRPPVEFDDASPRAVGRTMLALMMNHLSHWRLHIGLPLITPMVILSRTTLADSVLPVLPILFFATQTHASNDPLDFNSWPPSAGLAFSLLPYVRTAYNAYYRKVWAPREKKWLREIQPRARELAGLPPDPGSPTQEQLDAIRGHEDDEPMFEVRLEGDVWEEDWSDDEADGQGEGAGAGQEVQAVGGNEVGEAAPAPDIPRNDAALNLNDLPNPPPADEHNQQQPAAGAEQDDQRPANLAAAAAAANVQNANAQNQNQNQDNAAAAGGNQNRGLSFSVTPIAETILGALLFPTIAGLSGELLKLALPRSWTTGPMGSYRGMRVAAKGLLQEKWGRSLVGGCLFVVLKDAVMLYVRWKMAVMHRERRVVDWEGRKNGRTGGEATASS